MKKITLILLLSVLISLPVILPYFHSGYFPTHDGEWAVVRLTDMFRSLRDFQIPVRYSGQLNFGYGYPLFNFAYPMPYYLGMIPYFLGAGFVGSIKILFVCSVIFSAFFMFFASRQLWKSNFAGVISAVLYIYFPYRMVDLYVRGSIGESLSFILFPLLFFLAVKLVDKLSFLLVSGISIGVATLIMTHNIMTVLFLPLLTVFIIIQAILKNKKIIKPFILSIIFGFGLSAFFWIPAIFEKGNILLSKIPIADRNLYFVKLNQLVYPSWGYGAPVELNGFSYQLGLAHLAVLFFIILFFLFFVLRKKVKFNNDFVKSLILLTSFAVFYLFMLFKPSEFLWKLPLLSEINYPWICLGILGFIISLISGFFCKNKIGRYLVIIFVIIAIINVIPYAKPEKYISNPDEYYLTNDATTTSSKELIPLWVKEMPSQRAKTKVEILNGKIENISFNSKKVNFIASMLSSEKVKINLIYYPGWEIYVDNVKKDVFYRNKMGLIEILIPSGVHSINLMFKETPLRLTADIITFSTLVILLIMNVGRKHIKKYEFF